MKAVILLSTANGPTRPKWFSSSGYSCSLYISGFFFTFSNMQSEYHIFVDEFRRNPGTIWIMKPIAKSQGKGIFLFKKLKDITDWKRVSFFLFVFMSLKQHLKATKGWCFIPIFFPPKLFFFLCAKLLFEALVEQDVVNLISNL